MRRWLHFPDDMGRHRKRHRMYVVLLAVLIAVIAVIVLGVAYQHFVVDSIMDGGLGMENPEVVQTREEGRMESEYTEGG